MGRAILGIVAVACLDAVFIAYLYTNSEPELQASVMPAKARRPRPPKIAFPPLPNKPSTIIEPAEPLRSDVVYKKPIMPKSRVARKISKPSEQASLRRKNRSVVAVGDRKAKKADRYYAKSTPLRHSNVQVINDSTGTLILYKGPQAASASSRPRFVQPAKRSFVARTVAIVKKPWTWIKAAAAKMF